MQKVHAVVGIFEGPWQTGQSARDGAVLGFEDIHQAFAAAAAEGAFTLRREDISLFTNYRRIRDFLAACDTVYANCGPWAALLFVVRNRENIDVNIVREVRTVGWIGYIWQEQVAAALEGSTDQRVFPSAYAQSIWSEAAPAVSDARVYYPLIQASMTPTTTWRSGGTAGFFSALSKDKGFDWLPQTISRMRAAGHRIERLILAGECKDAALYQSVVRELEELDITVNFRGGLPNAAVRELMSQCDCVFFLSISSIESLGRIMLEAQEQAVTVITADFGAARDLVQPEYRIPVDYLAPSPRDSDTAHPLATLAVERWDPPPRLSPKHCYTHRVYQYYSDAHSPTDLLFSEKENCQATNTAQRFVFHAAGNAIELAEQLLDHPELLQDKAAHELIDLGGSLKQFLLSRDYIPKVVFTATSSGQRRTTSAPSVNQHCSDYAAVPEYQGR